MRVRLLITMFLLLVGADILLWRHFMYVADQIIVRTFDPLNDLILTLAENEKKVYTDSVVHSGAPHITIVFVDPVLSWLNACSDRPIARKSAFVKSLASRSFSLNYGAKKSIDFQPLGVPPKRWPACRINLSVLSCNLQSPEEQSKEI